MEFDVTSNFNRTIEIPDKEIEGKDKKEIEEIVKEELENDFVENNEEDRIEFWDSLEVAKVEI